MASNEVINGKLSTHTGVEVINPTDTDISEAISGLGPDNKYVLLERFDDSSRPWAVGFAQAGFPLPGEDAWTVEYREGAEQFQAFADRPVLERVLLGYFNSRPGWGDGLEWKLLMTHES